MAPIRILHIITSTDAGGSEMMLEKLCCRMRRDRFQQTVLSLKRVGSVGRRLQDTGVPVHSLGLSGVVINPRAFLEAVKLVRLLRPHIIQTWLYHADFFGLLISWVVPGVRMVWNIRCAQMELSHYPFHTRLTRWTCRWLSRHADAILTNSIAARDYHFSLGYTRYKWVVIENGFDTMTKTDWTYDRIVLLNGTYHGEYVAGSRGVFYFDAAYGLNQKLTENVSDHYPVYAVYRTDQPDDD